MRIVVNHLTRMTKGFICVAGIETETGNHIRPVLKGRLGTDLLAANGGPFDIGGLVELGNATHVGQPPEVEDYIFDPEEASLIGYVSPKEFWAVVKGSSRASLTEIFGDALTQRGNSCTVDLGTGIVSLGGLLAIRALLQLDRFDRVRLSLADSKFNLDVSVTDLRMYDKDYKPIPTIVSDVSERMAAGVQAVISVGLTRPWQKPGDTAPRHWLQANNIHLADIPGWRMGVG